MICIATPVAVSHQQWRCSQSALKTTAQAAIPSFILHAPVCVNAVKIGQQSIIVDLVEMALLMGSAASRHRWRRRIQQNGQPASKAIRANRLLIAQFNIAAVALAQAISFPARGTEITASDCVLWQSGISRGRISEGRDAGDNLNPPGSRFAGIKKIRVVQDSIHRRSVG